MAVVLGLMAGCGDGSEVVETPEILEGQVTAEGLRLEGAEGTGFGGVVVDVPADALPVGTTVRVRGVLEPTPLPATAEAIGPQIAVELGGLTPSTPISVQVPVDHGLRDAFPEVPDADCKVWSFDGSAWARVEPVGTTAHDVTIEITDEATVATGVVFVVSPNRCFTCDLPRVDDGCIDGDNVCLRRIDDLTGTVPSVLEHAVVVDGLHFHYLVSPSTNRLGVVDYALPLGGQTSKQTTSALFSASPVGTIQSRHPLTVDPDGKVWASVVGVGHLKFDGSRAPAFFTTGTTARPASVVIAPGTGEVIRPFVRTERYNDFDVAKKTNVIRTGSRLYIAQANGPILTTTEPFLGADDGFVLVGRRDIPSKATGLSAMPYVAASLYGGGITVSDGRVRVPPVIAATSTGWSRVTVTRLASVGAAIGSRGVLRFPLSGSIPSTGVLGARQLEPFLGSSVAVRT
ncbi:MAG: hypothetical protein H6732_18775, partial [Alphaproteobacteria bacterium]|nr:hypothetical protein [Alphaproteobacteria bacterium]